MRSRSETCTGRDLCLASPAEEDGGSSAEMERRERRSWLELRSEPGLEDEDGQKKKKMMLRNSRSCERRREIRRRRRRRESRRGVREEGEPVGK